MSPGTRRFQRGRDVGSGEHRLPHVRDIEQPGVRARMQVLGHDAALAARGEVAGQVVLHRHGVAGERHHAGAVAAVPGVERALFSSGTGVGSSGRAFWATQGLRDRAIRRRDAGSDDPPLSRYLRDSGVRATPYSVGANPSLARGSAFQRSLPVAVLLPERFRGPVAPSAAGFAPRSLPRRVPGTRHHALVRGSMPRGYVLERWCFGV